jgi:hypothetical protein
MEHLAARLAEIPGVTAVTLGGSRAQGNPRPDSDWDFGLYYRGTIDPQDVRALGYDGEVYGPGEWGPVINGGAWLTVDGERVDLIYRDVDEVERASDEADAGRFAVHLLGGFLAGIPTYVLPGEMAVNKVLAGSLPAARPYPDALREAAPGRWRDRAAFSVRYAAGYARTAHVATFAGMVAKAAVEVAHARLAERGEWVLNEKAILNRAGLSEIDYLLSEVGARTVELEETLERATLLLGISA